MGCIYRKRGVLYISWRDLSGKNCYQRIGEDRALAKATLKQIEGGLQKKKIGRRHGVTTEALPPVPTFNAAADAFIDRRKAIGKDGRPMRRSWKDDRARLDKYLRPHLGQKRLDEIHEGDVRGLIDKLRPVLAPQSIRNCLAIAKRIYNEQPRALHLENPVAGLDRADEDAIGPGWDPRLTPWLKTEDFQAVYLAMPELASDSPWRALLAAGALAGLRTGEDIALEWADLDFDARTIHVRRSVDGPLKDDESRIAPMPEALAGVFKAWRKLVPVGTVQVFQATGRGGRRREDGRAYVKEHTLGKVLRAAVVAVNAERKDGRLPAMKWSWATRHTFASRYVNAGGSMTKLAAILGHSTEEVTKRYAHLQPGNFTDQERALVDVQLAPAKVVSIASRTA